MKKLIILAILTAWLNANTYICRNPLENVHAIFRVSDSVITMDLGGILFVAINYEDAQSNVLILPNNINRELDGFLVYDKQVDTIHIFSICADVTKEIP